MESKPPLITAVILNYRSPRDTVQCVRALRQQTIADDALEILVVDNHSDDESMGFIRAQLQREQGVRIIEHRANLGFGRGNNEAAKQARGEYILILNPDNTFPPDGLERMLSHLKTRDDAGIVAPALVHPDGTVRPSFRHFPTITDLLRKRLFPKQWQERYANEMTGVAALQEKEVDWVVGACLLMKRELYERLGGFDERFFLFFEDTDICRRVHTLGKKVIYLPKVRVLDKKVRLSGSGVFAIFTKKTMRIHLVSAMKYFWKWTWAGKTVSAA